MYDGLTNFAVASSDRFWGSSADLVKSVGFYPGALGAGGFRSSRVQYANTQ
jgi:hypothetical protein